MCSEATRISSHTHRDEAHPTRSERVSGTMIDRFCTDGETPPRPRNSFPWAQLLSRVPAEVPALAWSAFLVSRKNSHVYFFLTGPTAANLS